MKTARAILSLWLILSPVLALSQVAPKPSLTALPSNNLIEAGSQKQPAEAPLPTKSKAAGQRCARLMGGPSGSGNLAVDWSAAHALTRLFSVESAYRTADLALINAMVRDDALQPEGVRSALDVYAAPLTCVCVTPVNRTTLGPARVEVIDNIALIQPGTGDVTLPTGVQMVVVNLRDMPAVEALRTILPRMVAPAMATKVASNGRRVRIHQGPVDEIFSATNVYRTSIGAVGGISFTPTGTRDLPIVLVTGETMAPQAAEFAGVLRLAGRAWIAGSSVLAEVAESTWQGVGAEAGVAVRTAYLETMSPVPIAMELLAQSIAQEDPRAVGDARWRREFSVDGDTRQVRVALRGRDVRANLNLYLLRDTNGDGEFSYPDELVATSLQAGARETIERGDLAPGHYEARVHGAVVPGETSQFDLSIQLEAAGPWPDVIPADFPPPGTDQNAFLQMIRNAGVTVPPLSGGSATRTTVTPINPFGQRHTAAQGKAEMRAALLVTHGMLRHFFPYFPVVGDNIDDRLRETLDTVQQAASPDRPLFYRTLRRFGEVLRDGHQFVFNYGGAVNNAVGYLNVAIEELGGKPMVRNSGVSGIQPGDIIEAVNDQPTTEWYVDELQRTSAASKGYRFDIASRNFILMPGPQAYRVRDPDGVVSTVTVQPVFTYPTSPQRRSGFLSDLGAPELYYLNMDGETTIETTGVRAALSAAVNGEAKGLVLDMRGYPTNINHYEVAQRLMTQPFASAVFRVREYTGNERPGISVTQYPFLPLSNPGWTGPIVLLTGNHAVSAAENFMMMLTRTNRLKAIIGRPSAATNGNVTGVQLPGGFGFTFTGMEVLFPDGATFHGIGIAPSITIEPSPRDYRDGIDREIMKAIEVLRDRAFDVVREKSRREVPPRGSQPAGRPPS